ncbi:MAG: AAA family ATPase, partial [Thomasclavelia spiroformis]
MQKTDSLFFTNIEIDKKIESVVEKLKEFSKKKSKQVYVIKKPLGSNIDFNYDINDIVLLLIPKHPILVLSYGNYSENQLEEYEEDLKEDLGILASKYEYNKILGRPRKWDKNLLKIDKIDDFSVSKFLEEKVEEKQIRKIDLLISLLIGSINNIDKIGIDEPKTTLDQIKQKIVLFDGRQSEFIYLQTDKKDITIQGMAGTGKTELLLYKLKEIFINEKDSTIAFTCYNKVLASEMKKRVPAFFNAMKIEEQIQWDEKMYVFPSWGSINDKVSGMYRYICSFYDLPFYTYSQNNDFDNLCKKTLEMLNLITDFKPCFDYVFIDESQDFGNHFFEMCNKVTKNKVFIAGDVFQNIFDNNFDDSITPDYLLNNCYRTDPRTLMIAHSIGLGLCEHPPISWLNDSEWKACGYQIKRNTKNREFSLTRRPLRRFEDIQATKTFELIPYKKEDTVSVV